MGGAMPGALMKSKWFGPFLHRLHFGVWLSWIFHIFFMISRKKKSRSPQDSTSPCRGREKGWCLHVEECRGFGEMEHSKFDGNKLITRLATFHRRHFLRSSFLGRRHCIVREKILYFWGCTRLNKVNVSRLSTSSAEKSKIMPKMQRAHSTHTSHVLTHQKLDRPSTLIIFWSASVVPSCSTLLLFLA